jgi:DNA-binding response OmpR family regulator
VDDDPLCSRAVVFALHKAEMNPDVAETGEQAVALAAEKFYDVIFMDIQMPGIDGMEACTQIHKGQKNKTTPVVFVTVRSDFHTRAQSSLAGGTDLLAKPFLMFEITVKALMFSMRKRLELAESLRREVAGLKGVSAFEGKAMLSPPAALPKAASTTAEPSSVPGVTNVAAEQLDQDIAKITVKGSCEDAVTIDRRSRKTARRFKHDEQKKRKVLITE